jgi:hypothetical protein
MARPRRPWSAALLSLLGSPGLGQLYNGTSVKAAAFLLGLPPAAFLLLWLIPRSGRSGWALVVEPVLPARRPEGRNAEGARSDWPCRPAYIIDRTQQAGRWRPHASVSARRAAESRRRWLSVRGLQEDLGARQTVTSVRHQRPQRSVARKLLTSPRGVDTERKGVPEPLILPGLPEGRFLQCAGPREIPELHTTGGRPVWSLSP